MPCLPYCHGSLSSWGRTPSGPGAGVKAWRGHSAEPGGASRSRSANQPGHQDCASGHLPRAAPGAFARPDFRISAPGIARGAGPPSHHLCPPHCFTAKQTHPSLPSPAVLYPHPLPSLSQHWTEHWMLSQIPGGSLAQFMVQTRNKIKRTRDFLISLLPSPNGQGSPLPQTIHHPSSPWD